MAERFIPLNMGSQNGIDHVLYYDSLAYLNSLYDCITGRLEAINLLEQCHTYHDSPTNALQAIAVVPSILFNDSYSLLDEFTPTTLKNHHIVK